MDSHTFKCIWLPGSCIYQSSHEIKQKPGTEAWDNDTFVVLFLFFYSHQYLLVSFFSFFELINFQFISTLELLLLICFWNKKSYWKVTKCSTKLVSFCLPKNRSQSCKQDKLMLQQQKEAQMVLKKQLLTFSSFSFKRK